VSKYFTENQSSVSDLAANHETILAKDFINHGIQISLADSKLGLCHNRHERIVYKYGYNHPHAIELAHLAARMVDAPKQGLQLKRDSWEVLITQLRADTPEYLKNQNDRSKQKSNHVMDVLLLQVIPNFHKDLLNLFAQRVGRKEDIPLDCDIEAFYDKVSRKYPLIVETMKILLKQLRSEWGIFWMKEKRSSQDDSNKGIGRLNQKMVLTSNFIHFRMNLP